jgi:hypothetical protein
MHTILYTNAAFTTHFSGIFQQFVVGQTKEHPPWVLNPAPVSMHKMFM